MSTDDDLEICRFPKHRGKLWEEVIGEDYGYVEWLVSAAGPDMSGDLYDRLMDLLEEWETER